MKKKMIEFLLNNANPSIKRRIKSEILNNLEQEEAFDYQREILKEPIIQKIVLSLDSFKRVLEVDSVLDISRPIKKGKSRIFNDYEKWPCRYHLDILAHTNSWKNEDNIRMLANSIKKMMMTDRPELINMIPSSWIGYELGSLGCLPSQGLSIKTSALLPYPIKDTSSRPLFYNLEYIEWFARCGIIPFVQDLSEAIHDIMNTVDDKGDQDDP